MFIIHLRIQNEIKEIAEKNIGLPMLYEIFQVEFNIFSFLNPTNLFRFDKEC